MARPRGLPPPDRLWALVDGRGQLLVRVTPNAGRDAILLPEADGAGPDTAAPVVRVQVTATPEDGKANAALVALLSRALLVPKSSIDIAQGQTGRVKRVRIGQRPVCTQAQAGSRAAG